MNKTKSKKAERAVSRFNRMIPSLRAYARTETGNPKLQLKAGAQSMTDGDTIWLAPPMLLGESVSHNGLCGKRDYGLQLCPACESNEYVVSVLRHEIGHIMHGSFDKFSKSSVMNSLAGTRVGQYDLDTYYRDKIVSSIDGSTGDRKWDLRARSTTDAMAIPLIGHVNYARHPWLSTLMLMCEDLRCDEARLSRDEDEREVYESITEDLMVNGIEGQDGTFSHYIDMELDMQMCMGFMFAATGAHIEGYFSDEVVDVMNTAKAAELGERALRSIDTAETFDVVLAVHTWLTRLGYLKLPEDQQAIEELIDAIGDLLRKMFGHGLDPSEVGDAQGGMGPATSDDGSTGPGLRPEDVAEALEAFKHLDHVPENVGPPKVYAAGDGPAYRSPHYRTRPVSEFKSDEKNVSPALTSARLAFGVNARVEHHRNQRSGKVAGKMLARRVPFADDRVFAKRVVPDRRSYHVLIGMDISGSTTGDTLEEEKDAVLAMADVCHRLGIGFEIWAHCSGFDSREMPEMYQIKGPKEAWSPKTRDNLRVIDSSGANLDGHTLQFYRKKLEQSNATDKVLMYYTDGAMPAGNYVEELEVIKSEIKYCKKNNITLMAVGMGVDTPTQHGFDTAVVNSPRDYRKVVDHLGKRLMR